MQKRKLFSPITILMAVIVLAAFCTWLIPSGQYHKLQFNSDAGFTISKKDTNVNIAATQQALDSLGIKISLQKFVNGDVKKAISIPGTYYKIDANPQGFISVLQAPIRGILDSIEIIIFVLFIGAFMQVFNTSGAMESGLAALSKSMHGKESWLIALLTILFMLGGATFGMAEEGLAFYAILTPIFIAAGYDLIVPVAVIFGGTQLGTLSSFSNPFSAVVASNAAGINWKDGMNERLLIFIITAIIMIVYIVRYANKVKKDPTQSLVYKVDGLLPLLPNAMATSNNTQTTLSNKNKLLLVIFFATFAIMITGVIKFGWSLIEMTTTFFAASVIVAIIMRMGENNFISNFIKGAESLLSVALVIGVARGVTIMLNEGNIADSIVHYSSQAITGLSPVVFIISVFLLYMLFNLFISSSSGMAVLTMPIMGALALMANVPGTQVVNSYLFGMGIMGFLTPTGLILPALALVNISFKAWIKFILPLIAMLALVCIIFLLIGVHYH